MKLTSKGRYAVTAMLDLAFHSQAGPVTLNQISQRQAISLSYLEQLFTRLRRRDLVTSTRGPGGGYTLNRDASEISVSEVILAVDENCQVAKCDDHDGGCHGQGDYHCLTHDLWNELSNEIRNFLDGISLAEVMANQAVKEVSLRQDKVQVGVA